jgi:hypothetical protein
MKNRYRKVRLPRWILAIATVCLGARLASAQPATSAREVVDRYCRMDASGIQLAPHGWLTLARMFVLERELFPGPIVVSYYKLEVIRGFSISDPIMQGHDRAKVTVHYSYVGQIDYDSLIFSSLAEPSREQMERTFNVRLTTKHYDIGSHDEEVLVNGVRAWRIEGGPFAPHITIDAAIQVVTRLRNAAKNSVIRRNADMTISALNQLRQK